MPQDQRPDSQPDRAHERAERGRPSPEALLAAAGKEGRGRLKIFLGAAPGVGKTYEMLQSGCARLAAGVDVVVGIVETHGRTETARLVEGLEIVPRRREAYKGRVLEEMDLDALLARRPALALVDELAHTNGPGSRHPKRYMDVEDLLAAGIDVYTTLNIQHVESLNDVVAQITRVRVQETVPDHVLEAADDIEVVDLAPADLIGRLNEGKIYLPGTAERAVANFFTVGNLTALRELALRRTAERVDDQLLTHMRAHAIDGPWAAGERVMVCVSEDPRSAALVRSAKRLADRLRAPWTALYVEGRRSHALDEAARDRIADALRLAEHLGGEAEILPAGDGRIADDVLAAARSRNVTHIVIGKSNRSRWFEILHGSVVHELVRGAGQISVHVIAGEPASGPAAPALTRARPAERPGFPYAVAVAAIAAALVAGRLSQSLVGIENIDLMFLTAIIAVAVRFGLMPALFATVLGSLAYNFFFLPPLYTLTIADPTNILTFAIFTALTLVVSNLAGRARAQAVAARGRARTTEALYSFSRKLAAVGTLDDLLWATAYQIASMLKVRVVVLLSDESGFSVRVGYPPEDMLDPADVAAAKWAFKHDSPAGRDSDTLPGGKWLFLPLRTGRGALGVVGLDRDKPGPLLTGEQRRLTEALIDQAALAIERIRLVADIEAARRAAEADRLRQALLSSISHDLRTPLASVMGAAGTLADFTAVLTDDQRAELVATIQEEAERLNRFIVNLLDMTRLEAGAVVPRLALNDPGEIVGAVAARAAKLPGRHKIDVSLAPRLPMVEVDPVLMEQALFNLIDNAAKFAPEGSPIAVQGAVDGRQLVLQVIDCGPGIPEAHLEQVFSKFYRLEKSDRVRAGTGLGLSICRGFVEAMGGSVSAENRRDREGAVFTIRLPVPAAPRRLDAETRD